MGMENCNSIQFPRLQHYRFKNECVLAHYTKIVMPEKSEMKVLLVEAHLTDKL
jgi:hypothetical protein